MQIGAHDITAKGMSKEDQEKFKKVEIPIEHIEKYLQDWIVEAECEMQSASELATKQRVIKKFLWWMRRSGRAAISERDGKAFLSYIINSHKTEKGRWGNKKLTEPPSRRTIRVYFLKVRQYFSFLVENDIAEANPFANVKIPKQTKSDIHPFTPEQIQDLLQAADKGEFPARDKAILSLLIDTGIRASELCGIRKRDLDLHINHGFLTVLGKGGKFRTLAFQRATAKYLWEYEQTHPLLPNDHYFVGRGGGRRAKGTPLTRYGLLQIFYRLKDRAKITGVRCSPHTCRHTFAIQFLRNGGNAFTLKAMLGHESLYVTDRYVRIAQTDIEAQHRQASPMDHILGLKKTRA